MSAGLAVYKLSFQVSPIILTNGIASAIPGGMLPIIAITEAINFPLGLLSGGESLSLDSFFATFEPVAGGSLIDQKIGKYPFANQAVAANAVISQPLAISLRMSCPVRQPGGYAAKLATLMALQAALAQHNNSGGTYTIATPAFFYTDCVMIGMRDASRGGSKQPQNAWILDFEKPLLTLDQAEQAQNSLMSRITSGTAIDGPPAWSGLSPTVGVPPSLAGPSIAPVASGAAGAGVAGSANFAASPFSAAPAP
jgi:hypothetical protein